MFRPRIIPVLLLRNGGLVKSTRFKDHKYIGDPINAVRIFNDLKVDELVFLDIKASQEKRVISLDFINKVGEEANMPFAVGGGIRTLEQIRQIINEGAEKVILNNAASTDLDFIKQATSTYGSSTIVVCIDVKKKLLGKEQTWVLNASKPTGISPVDYACQMEECGVGEVIVQSVDRDGMMNGYDINLIQKVSRAVQIPVVALGGAGSINDMGEAFRTGLANGLAAGSMFVYHGPRKGVLINYPEKEEIVRAITL